MDGCTEVEVDEVGNGGSVRLVGVARQSVAYTGQSTTMKNKIKNK